MCHSKAAPIPLLIPLVLALIKESEDMSHIPKQLNYKNLIYNKIQTQYNVKYNKNQILFYIKY